LTSNFHLKYLHVEGYRDREEVRKVWTPMIDLGRLEELRRREAEIRRRAERARTTGPLRRAKRRGETSD
jgi:hypothetical protein